MTFLQANLNPIQPKVLISSYEKIIFRHKKELQPHAKMQASGETKTAETPMPESASRALRRRVQSMLPSLWDYNKLAPKCKCLELPRMQSGDRNQSVLKHCIQEFNLECLQQATKSQNPNRSRSTRRQPWLIHQFSILNA